MIDAIVSKPEMHTIVFVDAVNFTQELKTHGRAIIVPKINQLRDFTEFFFVYKLKGEFIGKMGDGFLVLCPPTPAEVIGEALSCQSFVAAYNHGKEPPFILNTRIAIHYGLIAPPEQGNYIDTNLNLAARLEGAAPPNSICISSVLYEIVADTLRSFIFDELKTELKGLGENKYYLASSSPKRTIEPTRRESRLSFYFSTIDALRKAHNLEAVRETCEQALTDFPDNPEFTSQLAHALFELKEYIPSMRAYERCLQMDYDVARSLFYIGLAHRNKGRRSQAIDVFKQAVEVNPTYFHAMAAIAQTYLRDNDYSQAVKWAKAAFRVNPRFITPISIQAAVAIITKKDSLLKPLIKKIDADRHGYLRLNIEELLGRCEVIDYSRRLDSAFRLAAAEMKKKTKCSLRRIAT